MFKLLKEQFGKDMVFWDGGCDSQHVLPFKSADEIKADVKKNVEIFKSGGIKDNWFFELSSAKKAKLPFGKIECKKLLCKFKNVPYAISAIQGVFTNELGVGLRIIPEDNRIVLVFSTR